MTVATVMPTPNSIITEIFKDLHNLKHSDVFQNYPDHKSYDNVIKAVIPEYYKDWKEPVIVSTYVLFVKSGPLVGV